MAYIPRTAHLRRSYAVISMFLILAAICSWMTVHVYRILIPHHSSTELAVIWLVSFASIAWTYFLALLERPKQVSAAQTTELNKLKVSVLIPAYNEDPALLKASIKSLLMQTRKPNDIQVVDDGSTSDYSEVKDWLYSIPQVQGISLRWTRTDNGGKRHAQVVGMSHCPDADIYVTVDSDTVLDPDAIRQGLMPFCDSRIQSVAGLCLPINVTTNLLTRFSGLWETIWQLTERSAQSTMGCVTVNSGILAFYRGDTVRPYMKSYLREQFRGVHVKYSDDSLMTLYAMQHGKTIQQTSSIAFSAVPDKYSHYIRRYIRWMRGSFIRSFWRFKYLPLTSYIYWLHVIRWAQFLVSTAVFIYLLYAGIVINTGLLPYMVAVPLILSYAQALRYFTVKRSDESFIQQVLTYLTAPIAALWQLTVLRIVKWYAYATVTNNKWGTRKTVEVEVTA